MTGEIIPFEQFLTADEKKLLTFDIILGTFIGKWEMLRTCAP
jgi:hypothetical protein